jgi:cytosolic phospholipase A2
MNHVKPAFPEALADISITKNAIKTDFVIRKDIHDVNLFPEIEEAAEVRRGLDLAQEEIAFLVKRKVHVRNHFANYIGVDPAEVHPNDVPIVGFGGSGGVFAL